MYLSGLCSKQLICNLSTLYFDNLSTLNYSDSQFQLSSIDNYVFSTKSIIPSFVLFAFCLFSSVPSRNELKLNIMFYSHFAILVTITSFKLIKMGLGWFYGTKNKSSKGMLKGIKISEASHFSWKKWVVVLSSQISVNICYTIFPEVFLG